MLSSVLQLFALAFTFNLLAEFAPPTSLLLTYYYINTHINILLLTAVTVAGALGGRSTLYLLIRYFGAKFLSDNVHNGYIILRKIVHKNDFLTVIFMALYSLSPLSTAVVFIVAGAAKIKIWPLMIGFVLGRFTQYVFIALSVSTVYSSLQDIIGSSFANPVSIVLAILGIILAVLLVILDWEKLIVHKRLGIHTKIFKTRA